MIYATDTVDLSWEDTSIWKQNKPKGLNWMDRRKLDCVKGVTYGNDEAGAAGEAAQCVLTPL